MSTVPAATSRRSLAVLVFASFLAALAVHAAGLLRPMLFQDDFQIVLQSWTWQGRAASPAPVAWLGVAAGHSASGRGGAAQALWEPHNEHIMPPGRVTTWAMAWLSGHDLELFSRMASWQGPLAVVLGMALVFHFVRRELDHPLYGLVAMLLFGVTSIYGQAVFWFSASFSVLALDTFLLALVAAQAYRLGGGWWALLLPVSAGLCLLSACWFAVGVLAGPLCVLYLLPLGRAEWKWPRLLLTPVPALGTAFFLAVLVRRAAQTINELEHYRDSFHTTAEGAFRPAAGLWYTGRSLVENLLLGQLGVTGVDVPTWQLVPLLVAMAAVAAWWLSRVTNWRLALLGLALVLVSYWLTYSARANWAEGGEQNPAVRSWGMNQPNWARYHLLPQLGLAFVVVAGLHGRLRLGEADGLTPRQALGACLFLGVLLLVQSPRGYFCAPGVACPKEWQLQHEQFAEVARVEGLCRRHRLSAEAVRGAFPRPSPQEREWLKRSGAAWTIAWPPEGWTDKVAAYDFLLGSDDPVEPQPGPAEVRRLLGPE